MKRCRISASLGLALAMGVLGAVATAGEGAPAGGKPDRILFVGATRLTYLWEAALKEAGWNRIAFEKWDNLNAGLLRQCRAVVMVALPLRPDLTPHDDATIKLLDDYVEAGGGLLLNQQAGQMNTVADAPLRPGPPVRHPDPAGKDHLRPGRQPSRSASWGSDRYTYTDQVSGPVAEGVRGVLYQSYVEHDEPRRGHAAAATIAMAGGPRRRAQLPNRNLPPGPGGSGQVRPHRQGFARDVPLAAVRECGKGRVGYFGMLTDVVFTRAISSDDDRKGHEAYLTHGVGGFPSDLQKLYLNTFPVAGGPRAINSKRPSLPVPQWRPRPIPRPGSHSKA